MAWAWITNDIARNHLFFLLQCLVNLSRTVFTMTLNGYRDSHGGITFIDVSLNAQFLLFKCIMNALSSSWRWLPFFKNSNYEAGLNLWYMSLIKFLHKSGVEMPYSKQVESHKNNYRRSKILYMTMTAKHLLLLTILRHIDEATGTIIQQASVGMIRISYFLTDQRGIHEAWGRSTLFP